MVGSGGSDRSKEAVGMMALHEALRNVCLNSDWTYSVFWTIRPRPRSRGGNGCKIGDDNGSLMLMWEDGFCRQRVAECLEEIEGEDPVRRAFSKMSIQLYNYGEGLMGKVASDKCHKWVFKEPTESEPNISNYWQSSFDALPPEWIDQFNSGIQTIAVIQAGHGLLQLGSCKIIPEDLHFVLRMRHTFESLGYQSGFFLSQLFSATRTITPPPPSAPSKPFPTGPPAPIFNWSQRPIPPPTASTPFHNSAQMGLSTKDEPHHFLLPNATNSHMQDMITEHDNELKWPHGLSFFNALTGRPEESKLHFEMDASGNKLLHNHQFPIAAGKSPNNGEEHKVVTEGTTLSGGHEHMVNSTNPSEHLSLESHSNNARKMEHKFKRSFTMPARMVSSANSSSLDLHVHHPVESYRSSEGGIYSDMMGTFLE